jgi:conserved hypothetical protein
MPDGTDGPAGSGALEATPGSLVEALEVEPAEVAPISLGRRLRQPRTILSIIVPLAIIAFFLYLNRERLTQVPELILKANPALVLLAFVVFYLGFPLRGYRWERLLRETGFVIGLRESIEILYISWFVNCVVPAKLGDVYRAYLLKMNSAASLSRTFGTVFIERILDIFAIALLGLAAGFWSFRNGLPDAIRLVFVVGTWSSSWPPSVCSPCATSAGACSSACRCRHASSSSTSDSRRASSARSACATCRYWRPSPA